MSTVGKGFAGVVRGIVVRVVVLLSVVVRTAVLVTLESNQTVDVDHAAVVVVVVYVGYGGYIVVVVVVYAGYGI
jgi:hypothetical protein